MPKWLPESNTYGPVGPCIYCGTTGSECNPITDEHIVPEGMAGAIILEKASCRDCARIISRAEGLCQRKMFPGIRALYGLYGKRRKKTRPMAFKLRLKTARKLLEKLIPLDEYPFMAMFPS